MSARLLRKKGVVGGKKLLLRIVLITQPKGDEREFCCQNTSEHQLLRTIGVVTGCLLDVVLYLLPFPQRPFKRIATAVVR
jgi:hypothetical protein